MSTIRRTSGMSGAARLVWGLGGALGGIGFAATVARWPWVLLLGLAVLAVAAALGGYDSRDGEGTLRPRR